VGKINSKTNKIIRSGSRYTVRLVKSLGQAVDTHELE
jgi:hypothetical protein